MAGTARWAIAAPAKAPIPVRSCPAECRNRPASVRKASSRGDGRLACRFVPVSRDRRAARRHDAVRCAIPYFKDRNAMADLSPLRVLVIDDDADTRANLCDILELDGYQVETAGSAAEALRRQS